MAKISEIVQTAGWKNFMAKLYGWGASVVLAGALFKIQHYPGASLMLTIGMGTEVVIFFFSAFEPIHEEVDWSLVYPELAGLDEEEENGGSHHGASSAHGTQKGGYGGVVASGGAGLKKLEAMMEGLDVNGNLFENLGEGLNKLNQTTANLSDLSDATVATSEYANQVQNASEAVNQLTNTFVESNDNLNKSVDELSNSYKNTAEMISNSGSQAADKFSQSGNDLLATYQELADAIKNSANGISGHSDSYAEHISTVNKGLSALNTVYELQLQETNNHLKNTEEIFKGFNKMMGNLKESADETQNYKDEVAKLSKNISDLNNVYGNMLSSLSFVTS